MDAGGHRWGPVRLLPREALTGQAEVAWGPVETPWGPMIAARSKEGLCFLSFPEGAQARAAQRLRGAVLHRSQEALALDAPVAYGTAFQHRVWAELLRLPPGATTTYGAIAQTLNVCPRAVGGAVARNPLAILIPCHRVLGTKGALGGYAWGAERKRALLRADAPL